jgi:hypothetical protein
MGVQKLFKHTMIALDLLDNAKITGEAIKENLLNTGAELVTTETVVGKKCSTDFVRITIPGYQGKIGGGSAPTIGVIGRLGGIGARPEKIGLVSDGDGAVTVIACALKLLDMKNKGDLLKGDVVIVTHLCPDSDTKNSYPVQYMSAPLDARTMSHKEKIPEADAILTVDTTKGNRIINVRGFAITPTVRQGYILPVSNDLLDIMEIVSGKAPVVLPLCQQDITPYANELYHLNSIMQPSTVTDSPVVGVAITTETAVPGSATGATHLVDLEQAGRFVIEVAKAYGAGELAFYNKEEFATLQRLYGPMNHFQEVPKH